MKIKLIAINFPKELYKDKFKQIALELTNRSQLDKGCISYVLNEEINGNKFIFIEEWENEELLQKHMEKQKKYIQALRDLSEKNSEVIFIKDI
ncbi:antibiotic biosynthesis monooxygenase [Campylobacter lari]|uniref:putative quinol monooxygenase n=1 Tax=Campylobacter lari TaxID=201 RepID=UPI00130B8680|nr:antibiotic biosynthesis monooxygenase [Campylobacter lari]EGH4467932.1 hypothetical protein [Campylobacter lari]EGK8048457.1 hypothetical protein [Campylobacter lari]MBT0821791.1 antibiotic biosynthesis monooxygenase [Campylobacter lari]MBT0829557.1 antibiotic biosynthesis monooxygenase [Campylobacter lari]MCR6777351.1 antibiotic biosynthesis monooxygenase [Campylobacter lari]